MSLMTSRALRICCGVTTALRGGRAGSFRHHFENLPLLGARRIADLQFQHEAVHLRFGQRIGAFLFDRILRGQHEERFVAA